MIVIEGSDFTGKTTLAKDLQRQLNCAYVHYGPMPLWWTRYDYLTRHVKHAVYDRYHWSAAAYLNVAPQPWGATAEACQDIDKMLEQATRGQYATVCLYASQPEEWYPEDFEDPLFTRAQVIEVNNWFSRHSEMFTIDWDLSVQGRPCAQDIRRGLNNRGIRLDGQ